MDEPEGGGAKITVCLEKKKNKGKEGDSRTEQRIKNLPAFSSYFIHQESSAAGRRRGFTPGAKFSANMKNGKRDKIYKNNGGGHFTT